MKGVEGGKNFEYSNRMKKIEKSVNVMLLKVKKVNVLLRIDLIVFGKVKFDKKN